MNRILLLRSLEDGWVVFLLQPLKIQDRTNKLGATHKKFVEPPLGITYNAWKVVRPSFTHVGMYRSYTVDLPILNLAIATIDCFRGTYFKPLTSMSMGLFKNLFSTI